MGKSGNHANRPRYGVGVQGIEPDWDAPWHCDNVTLPVFARCETCEHWAGICLDENTVNRVTRAEDRCMAWQQARAHREHVERAEASWGPIEPQFPVGKAAQ